MPSSCTSPKCTHRRGLQVLAGALKDNGRARIVGERTFGKGLIQTIVELTDGSGVAVTVARYQTPAGTDINKVGQHAASAACLYSSSFILRPVTYSKDDQRVHLLILQGRVALMLRYAWLSWPCRCDARVAQERPGISRPYKRLYSSACAGRCAVDALLSLVSCRWGLCRMWS